VKFSRSVGFAEFAHLGGQRAVVDDAFLASEVFQRVQEMSVVAVAGLKPSVSVRLVGLADLGDQVVAEFVPGAQSRIAGPKAGVSIR
jgi:hypothetical protein